ncbi:hypothetical protein ACROYT_G009451 [Oculina patagonica]
MKRVFLLCLMSWFFPSNVSSDILRNKCRREADFRQPYTDELFNYDMIFQNKNGNASAVVSLDTTITSFTLCLWLQTTDPGPFHLFSYVTRNDTKKLSLECESDEDCKLLLLQDYRQVSLVSLNDGKWRHVCLTWSSAAGDWNVYLDGAVRGSGSGLGTGLSLYGSGRLVLGQDQANAAKSFIGTISKFNWWDHVIDHPSIKNMSQYCYRNHSLGNVLFWSEFRKKMNGQVEMRSQSSCNTTEEPCPPGKKTDDPQGRCCVFQFVYKGVSYDSCTSINHTKLWCSFDAVYAGQWANCADESRFILNFPSASVNNVVVRNVNMPSLSAGTICWWMKNAKNDFNVFSYVAPGGLNSALEIYFGIFWKLHLGLGSTRVTYSGPPLADSYWHHLCTDWNSSTTVWHVYLDGVLQFTETKGQIKDRTVQGGGVFHLGQFVQNGAYHTHKPFQGMLTGFNIWTKTLSARAVAALAREPGSESGDALAWSMLREGIMGSVEISHGNDVGLTARASEYTLNFTRKSSNSYADVSGPSIYMTQLSACAWIKTTAWSGELTIFSYSNDDHVTAIVWSIIDGNTIQMNINAWDPKGVSVSSNLADGSWHHVCISWNMRQSGPYWLYVDQQTVLHGTGYKTNDKVVRNGRFIIGQRQTSLVQSAFDASKAFVGEMTRLNVWDIRLEPEYAENMGRGCGLWNGNVVRWSKLKSNLVGDIQVIPGSECFVPDISVQERRNAMCQNSVSFVECQGLNSFSLFDFANLHGSESGRRLRCYNEDALTSSDYHYRKTFDKVKGSTCAKNMPQELMNITR